jgi:hypothetical protein
MAFLGKRQVLVFLYLHLANAVGEFVVPAREKGDLLDQMLVDGAFDRGGTDDDTLPSQERRQQPEDCAANGPDQSNWTWRGSPGGHQIEESAAMPLLVPKCFLKPRKQIRVAHLGECYLRAID